MRRCLIASCLLASLAGCKPVTEILLVVRSDVPDQLKSVHVFVSPNGSLPPPGGPPYAGGDVIDPGCQCLNDSGCPAVPFSLGMLPDDPDHLPPNPFELAVDGYARRGCTQDVFIEAKARVRFVHEQTLALYLDLLSACEGLICPPNYTCDPILRTCKDDTVPADQLVPVDPGSVSFAELGAQPDLSLADFAGVDTAGPPDLARQLDFTLPPDLTPPPDLAGVDQAGLDFAVPPDFTTLPDQSMPQDFAMQDFAMQDFATQDFATQDFAMQDFAMQDFAMQDFATQDFAMQDFAVDDQAMQDMSFGMKDMSVAGPGLDGGCFVAGTLVWTAAGPVPIEQVAEGARVVALDADSALSEGPLPTARVRRFIAHEVSDVVDVSLGGATVTATLDHPFFVLGRGFVAAAALRPGDLVERADGGASPVESVAPRRGRFTVYNLELDALHAFFVGPGRWLVHNAGGS